MPDDADLQVTPTRANDDLRMRMRDDDDVEDDIIDLDKELEAAIQEARADGAGGAAAAAQGQVQFRTTLSTSSSEDDRDMNSTSNKHKYKKTPLPKRREKKPRKIAQKGKNNKSSDEENVEEKKQRPKTPPSIKTAEMDLLDSEGILLKPDAEPPVKVSTSVTHKEIQKFLHKSKMQMEVEDVRRAFANARTIGERARAAAATTDTKKKKGQANTNEKTPNNVPRAPPRDQNVQRLIKDDLVISDQKATDAKSMQRSNQTVKNKIPRPINKIGGSKSVPDGLDRQVPKPDSTGIGTIVDAKTSKLSKPKSLSSLTQKGKVPTKRVVSDKENILQATPPPPPSIPPKKGVKLKSGPPKPTTDAAESAKRLELIKAARSNKRRVDPGPSADNAPGPPPATEKAATGSKAKAALPIMVKPEGAAARRAKRAEQAMYADASEDFYRDFKIIYVVLPTPRDELPRK